MVKLYRSKIAQIQLVGDKSVPFYIYSLPPWEYIQANVVPPLPETSKFVFSGTRTINPTNGRVNRMLTCDDDRRLFWKKNGNRKAVFDLEANHVVGHMNVLKLHSRNNLEFDTGYFVNEFLSVEGYGTTTIYKMRVDNNVLGGLRNDVKKNQKIIVVAEDNMGIVIELGMIRERNLAEFARLGPSLVVIHPVEPVIGLGGVGLGGLVLLEKDVVVEEKLVLTVEGLLLPIKEEGLRLHVEGLAGDEEG
nr:hypothetical protein [Tanacetum cinerariifolium]